MEIHTTLENYIKPSTPTPSHLQTFKLSDQHRQFPDSPFNVTFFYHSNSPAATNFSLQSKLLQHSLAQTLTTFYLFAGRFKNDDTIICNDHGALFIESKTDTNLSDLLAHPDLLAVIRDNLVPSYRNNGSLLLVKYISFGCGGTAVSISVSHKIADLASLVTLLLHWTALSGGAGAGASDHIPIYQPDFNLLGQTEPHPGPTIEVSSSSSPSPSQPSSSGYSLRPSRKFISKRFVFSASKIKQLKNQVVKELSKIENDHPLDILPSRVDVVVGLIFKSAMVSANVSRSRVGIVPSFRPSLLIQAANIRTRMNPPLPESVIGNLTMLLPVTVEKESDMELHELVNKLLAGKIHANKLGKKFHGYDDDTRKVAEAIGREAMKEIGDFQKNYCKDLDAFVSTSWCKFPLLEIDFGLGKPVWVTNTPTILVANTLCLLDTKEVGGVEALVHLYEEDMSEFQLNQELLQFATVV